MTEYVSGEQHAQNKTNNKQDYTKPFMIIAVGLVLIGIGFAGGATYQKSQQKTATTDAGFGVAGNMDSRGPGGGRFGGQRPTVGSVTTITTNSITIKSQMDSSSTTLAITSSTKITNDGQAVDTASIKAGDTVFVIADTSDKTKAAQITLNPGSMMGGPTTSTTTESGATVTN